MGYGRVRWGREGKVGVWEGKVGVWEGKVGVWEGKVGSMGV